MEVFKGKKVGFSFTFGPLVFSDYLYPVTLCILGLSWWIFAVIVGLLHEDDEQLLFFIMTH